ncbi:DNA repair protein RecN [Adlercreutzia sp. ZJ141]|uniref:DNA repair protein RecN n=1 Tax=Adlercreutzia sp. ZJ141 TaxID=2709406 RepID=UPI0013EC82E2|nr:DNA repair protein RecN [Adlercreutzia sp. ZJ141]
MIDEIQVENLALIRSAALCPARGMTVVTGETGAGKTALLSACKLLMGARADKDAVRDGESALRVSGRFYFNAQPGDSASFEESAHVPAVGAVAADPEGFGGEPVEVARESLLEYVGPDASDSVELVAVRSVTADGRSRVSIDGHMASVGELARCIAPRIDLCGQHEHQQLMKSASHLRLLDAWAGDEVATARQAYAEAFSQAEHAAANLARVLEARESSSAKLDEARFVLKRMEAVRPEAGEYDALATSLSKAEHAETLAVAANAAHESLAGEGGALDGLNAAVAALDQASCYDESLAAYAESLREAGYVLEDVARDARAYRDDIEFDEAQLRAQQERMSELQGLLRAYGPRMEDVIDAWERAAEVVSLVDDASERERAARAALDQAESELACAAAVLGDVRTEAAPRFARAVTAQMARLEMGGSQLVCDVSPLPREQWTRAGAHSVEFLFRPGDGMQARPLARIASGGEVSRVMLAVKVVLGDRDEVDTLVFDEVDAGVGGSTAVALADVLADLARTHQVIVVTHLAQVAVRGDTHYVVRKIEGADGLPETDLCCLGVDERPAEIARMLSGEATDVSLAHARELLAAAR